MGLFNIFRKKEPRYNVTNIKVTDLDKNFVFDYDLSSWLITAMYEYDWGDNFFTREFKIESDKETAFLNIEEDDELQISISKKVKIRHIDNDLPEYIIKNECPPNKLEYKGKTFFLEGENPGYFNDTDYKNESWIEFISWDYTSEDEKYVLSIEQWGENKFEATYGKFIKEYEISNIYPHK